MMALLYEASWQECRDKCLLKRSKSVRTIDSEADEARTQPQGEFWEHRRGIGWTRKFHPHELRVYPETFPPRLYQNVPHRDFRTRQRRSSASSLDMPPDEEPPEEEFAIPRPKLIVPVHTYGIRKRRTGNMLQRSPGTEGGGRLILKWISIRKWAQRM
jgi:hypothetical protein